MTQDESFIVTMEKLMPALRVSLFIFLIVALVSADQYFNFVSLFSPPQWGPFIILFWCLFLVWLGVKFSFKIFSQSETLHWVMLNYGVPLLFIIIPVLWTGFLPGEKDWVKGVFFPANGSLWVFTVLFYIIVQSELEKTLAEMRPDHPERWRSLTLSTFCQAIIAVGAMCYVMPLIADFYGAFDNYPQYRLMIAIIGLIFTTLLPSFGIVIMNKIQRSEKNITREVVYPL